MAHVLVVEDSPTEAKAIRDMLEDLGYQVSTAGNGAEGVEVARQLRPDLVLMDVLMPGMSGFQAVRKISRDPDIGSIPVVIVSIKNAASDKAWGLRQGARDYLTKPFSAEDLKRVVQGQLGEGA